MKYIDELTSIQQELLVPELLATLRGRFSYDNVPTDKVIELIEKRRNRDRFKPQEHIVTIESKPCPQCQTPWVKNGGCKHMHCRTCGHHFCWDCGQPFTIETHPSFYSCPLVTKHRLRTERTGMVLANHEENEFVEEAKAEANQRNDSVGISLSFQSLND
eukprot:UN25759